MIFKFLLFFGVLSLNLFAKEFLLIGDSMAEAVAKPLLRHFENEELGYRYIFKRGTQVHYWINNTELYLSQFFQKKNDVVLISLGTNDLVAMRSNEKIIENLHILIDEISSYGVKKENIFLIATPLQNDSGLNDAMEVVFGDHLIKSKDLLLELGSDNIHPLSSSNKIWSEHIVEFLRQKDLLGKQS